MKLLKIPLVNEQRFIQIHASDIVVANHKFESHNWEAFWTWIIVGKNDYSEFIMALKKVVDSMEYGESLL